MQKKEFNHRIAGFASSLWRINLLSDVCHSFKFEKKTFLPPVKSFLLLYLLIEYSFIQLISIKPFVIKTNGFFTL